MVRNTEFKESVTGVKSQDEEWFTNDVLFNNVHGKTVKFLVLISINSNVKVQVTKNSGNNWHYINTNQALQTNTLYEFGFLMNNGDQFNIRTDDASGTTVNLCEVYEDRF